jgi:capsular polysaccharide biosynthesis protein
MSEQSLDLRRSMRIVWRSKVLLGIAAAVGLLAGVTFAVLRPPLLSSKALVVLSPSASRTLGTQVFIADSYPVLLGAARQLNPPVPLPTLRDRVQASGLSTQIISISARGTTAGQAEATANAVARSYIDYVSSAADPLVRVPAQMLQPATTASRTPAVLRFLVSGLLGALAGLLIGAIVALLAGRGDRRLRSRDEIADAIGIPVLAGLPTSQPRDAAGWASLLDGYEPGAVEAWNLRKALHHLSLTDTRDGHGTSLAVLSLSTDRKALALGPQLAAYAASLGIPTAFVLGPPQDANVAAILHTACAAAAAGPSRQGRLRIGVSDRDSTGQPPEEPLTVVTAVVDAQDPQVAETRRTTVTVLGVSAGAATAEQLARLAVSAGSDDRQISGILVANPDPADHTTGRLPDPVPPGRRKRAARLTSSTSESSW